MVVTPYLSQSCLLAAVVVVETRQQDHLVALAAAAAEEILQALTQVEQEPLIRGMLAAHLLCQAVQIKQVLVAVVLVL